MENCLKIRYALFPVLPFLQPSGEAALLHDGEDGAVPLPEFRGVVGVAEQPAVIGHQEACHGIQKLLAFQVVVVPHPPVGEVPVEHMGETDHALRKMGQAVLSCVGCKARIQGVRQEGGVDALVPLRHQAWQGDLHAALRMSYGNAVYLGSRFHKDWFRHKVCGIDEVAQGTGDPFRTPGGIQAQFLIVLPICAGVGCHGVYGV